MVTHMISFRDCQNRQFGLGTDPILLHILLLFLLRRCCSKQLNAQSFQIGSGQNLAGMFFSEYTSVDFR